jgi:eukaryotic-like serine/threonine-protein kinase
MSGIPAGAGALLGKRLGKFEILALLALGGTAEIYLARIGGAAGFEKYVVVKCLHDHLADDQEFVKMFLDEARLAAHLDHSNIVQTMELGEHENRYYMVMEFLAGLSLAMVIRRAGERLQGGRLPIPLALNILAQACAGLHYAHEKNQNGKPLNIVHRDISPQNLVISFEGVVKVVDFGIAKAELRETKTRSGTIKGKFAYMSPEQCVATNVDRRTDVFALGVIAHELLTGRRLFKKPSPYETYQAVIECNVGLPSRENVEIDPALDPIIMKAVAKDKESRYPTAEAFGDAILSYLHHRGKGSGPGEVSRFFDASFGQEIEEHGARMRELIQGRDYASIDTGVGWGEEDDPKKNETVDLGGKGTDSVSLDSIDMLEMNRESARISGAIGDDDEQAGDEDDMPADRTRIQENPLEQINQLDQVVAKGKTPAPELINPNKTPAPSRDPSRKTPMPLLVPTQIAPTEIAETPKPRMPPSGPLPLPPPPAAGKPSSGKFPQLANLPTMIAEPDDDSDDDPGNAPTRLGAPILPDRAEVDPHGRTNLEMQPPSINGVRVSPPVPPGNRPQSVPPLPPMGAPQPPVVGSMMSMPSPQGPAMPAGPSIQPRPSMVPPPQGPAGYPVMNAELREQVAAGATVFPTDPSRAASVGDSGPHDPAHAANLASPVGGAYGDVDWAAAAAAPAKAIAPWKLALIFIGALGLALGITVLIARLAT